MAKGYQDPDLKSGLVSTPECVILRPSHFKVSFLGALKNGRCDAWISRILFLRPSKGIWEMRALAYSLNDAREASRKTLERSFLREADSSTLRALKLQVSSFGQCLSFVCRSEGGAAVALTTNLDDARCCGGPGGLQKVHK